MFNSILMLTALSDETTTSKSMLQLQVSIYFLQGRTVAYGWEFLVHTVVIVNHFLWKVGI